MTLSPVVHDLKYFQTMREYGFALVPCSDKKQPLVRFGQYTRAGGGALPTDAEYLEWLARFPGCNWLMIAEGTKVGIVFGDVDDLAQIGEIAASGQQLSPLQQGTTRGCHPIYRRPTPTTRVISRNGHLTGSDFKFVDLSHTLSPDGKIVWGSDGRRFGHSKIDVKADGAYCVHVGSARKDGNLYTLTFNGAPIDPLVAFNPEWLEANVPVFDNAAWERTSAALKAARQGAAIKARAARDKAFPRQKKNAEGWKTAAAFTTDTMTTLEPVIQWAREQPNQVSHDAWRGIATNIAAVYGEEGRARFHQISAGYTAHGGYSEAETDYCYTDALASVESHGAVLYDTLVDAGYPGDLPLGFNAPAAFLRAGEAKKSADETLAFLLKDLVYVFKKDLVYSHSRRSLYPVQSIRHMYSGGGVAARWEASLQRQTADDSEWNPTELNSREGTVNTYDPREVVKPGDNASLLPGFYCVLESLTQNAPGGMAWLEKLIAYQFRNLGKRWTQCVIMHGIGGAGKGLLGQYLQGLYRGYFGMVRSSDVASPFNGWLEEKLVIFGDEILEANGGEYALSTQLKNYITEPTFSVNRKGVNQYPASNHTCWYIASNKDKPLQLDKNDRRYTVFHQTVALDHVAGKVAYDEANSPECIRQLAAYLHTVDLTGFDPRLPFETEAKTALIESGYSPAEHYWKDCWRTGTFTADEVYADFLAYCTDAGYSQKTMERWSKTGFSRQYPHNAARGQRTTATDRSRTVTLPPLPDGQPDPTPTHRLRRNTSALSPLPRRPTSGY